MDLSTLLSKLGETWPARLAKAAAHAVTLPGDVYAGRVDPMSDDAIGRAADLAGVLGTGGIPMAQRGAAGIFGGRLAKTADRAALQQAEEMAARGVDQNRIWKDTGWFQGVDGKWRFEIPDNELTVRFGAGEGVIGGKSKVQHRPLAEAYPELADMRHTLGKGEVGQGWFFSDLPASGTSGRTSAALTVEAPNLPRARKLTAHELQHAIQQKEGFAVGGNPDEFLAQLAQNAPAAKGRAHEAYRRLAGEVEARNAETRLDFSPQMRASAPPWLTEDVRRSQQVLRANDRSPATGPSVADILLQLSPTR